MSTFDPTEGILRVNFKDSVEVPFQATTVICKDGKKIKGTYLLELVHEVVQKKIADIGKEDTTVFDVSDDDTMMLTKQAIITEGEEWLSRIDQWPIHGSPAITKIVEIHKNRFKLTGGENNPRIHFKGDDLKYWEIIKKISSFETDFKLKQTQIAALQLYALSRKTSDDELKWFFKMKKEDRKELLEFLDFLNALMFGVEGSYMKPEATVAISLMTLDLIAQGDLTYEDAFDGDKKTLGGAYPYAIWGNKLPPERKKRDEILKESIDSDEQIRLKKYRKDPKKSPILLKEAILIRHWLSVNNVDDAKKSKSTQVEKIQKAVKTLVTKHFSVSSVVNF